MAETAIAEQAPLETPVRDWSGLEAEIGDEPEVATAEPPAPEPEKEAPKAGDAAAPVVEETPEELKALDALLANDKEPEAEKETPAPKAAPLTPEIQQIEQLKSDPALAKDFLGAARSMLQLEQAISSGDMNQVVGMFAPAFQSALAEHIYQQNKEAFVQRFIEESEGKAVKPDPRVAQLEAKLASIEGTLTERQKREQALEQQSRTQQQQKNYNDYWDALFKAVNVTEPKTKSLLRGWVLDSIAESARSGDKDARKAIDAIKQGRFAPIGKKFRGVYDEWIKDQKAKTTTDTSIRNAQEQKQTGKLGTSPAETTVVAEATHDADGKRTGSFWKEGLKKLGLD